MSRLQLTGCRLQVAEKLTLAGLAGHELVGHGHEVVGELGSAVGEADEDAVVSEVVVGGVVEVGGFGEEGGPVAAIHTNEERVGLGGFVGGDAGHHVALHFEGWRAEGGGLLYVGEGAADFEGLGEGEGHGKILDCLATMPGIGGIFTRPVQAQRTGEPNSGEGRAPLLFARPSWSLAKSLL